MSRFVISPLGAFGRVLWSGALTLAVPGAAWAFCPTRTCEFDGTQVCQIDPSSGCASGGELARWDGNCISYTVQIDGSPEQDISSEELRGVLDDGFRAWSEATCPAGSGRAFVSPGFSASYRGGTRCDEVEYNCEVETNENIVMFRDFESGLSANTIALSTIIANLRTGEILDVDIEINSRDFDFYLNTAPASPGAHNLRLVINHEIGHMLGLSHSHDADALMRAEYQGGNPTPQLDDVRGMCSIFPGATADPVCPAGTPDRVSGCVGSESSCSVAIEAQSGCSLAETSWPGVVPGVSTGPAAPGRFAWAAGLGFVAMGGWMRRRVSSARRSHGC
jgi:hypothetical protein